MATNVLVLFWFLYLDSLKINSGRTTGEMKISQFTHSLWLVAIIVILGVWKIRIAEGKKNKGDIIIIGGGGDGHHHHDHDDHHEQHKFVPIPIQIPVHKPVYKYYHHHTSNIIPLYGYDGYGGGLNGGFNNGLGVGLPIGGLVGGFGGSQGVPGKGGGGGGVGGGFGADFLGGFRRRK